MLVPSIITIPTAAQFVMARQKQLCPLGQSGRRNRIFRVTVHYGRQPQCSRRCHRDVAPLTGEADLYIDRGASVLELPVRDPAGTSPGVMTLGDTGSVTASKFLHGSTRSISARNCARRVLLL
jgi:hypothetical protein